MKKILFVLVFLLALTITIQAASPWTISFTTPVDNAISKVTVYRNAVIAASPGPVPTPTPWTDQLTFESACKTGVLNMISQSKVSTGTNFCRQWNNDNGSLPNCNTTPPAVAACAFTATQKNTLCQNAGRPNGCDLCP